jgi:hypothetical protein
MLYGYGNFQILNQKLNNSETNVIASVDPRVTSGELSECNLLWVTIDWVEYAKTHLIISFLKIRFNFIVMLYIL